MKKVLLAGCSLLTAICIAQTPPNPLNDPNWQLQWYNDFTPTTGSKVWSKSSLQLTCPGCATATQAMDVQDQNDHGGEPVVNLDANTTIGADFSNTADANNYLRFQAIRQDYTCTTQFCGESNHHYSSGGTSFWGVQYGYLEMKAKISNTYANWAAFWLWNGTTLNNIGGASGTLYSYDPNPNSPVITNVSSGSVNLYAASIIDYQNGYVVGANGKVLKSTNLAPQPYQTWTALTSTAFGATDFHGVCFTNINTGYIVGTGGKVVYTGNASSASPTWSYQTLSSGTHNLNGVCFPWANYPYTAPYYNTGYIVADGGYFYSTTDGSTWSSGTNVCSYNLKAVASNDMALNLSKGTHPDGNVYAVGGDATHGVLYYSNNFGSLGSWTQISTLPVTNKCFNSISFSDANHCFIAGDGGTLIEGIYTSGAWSWNNLSSSISGTPNLYSLSSLDAKSGYVVGASGAVYLISNINNSTGSVATVADKNPSPTHPFGTGDLYCVASHYDYDEMDIFEQAAGTCNGDVGSAYYGKYNDKNTLTCNTWVNGYNNSSLSSGTVGNVYPINDFSQWHTYGLEWSPSTVTYYIDNQISRIVPNPGYQPSTGNGGFISQTAYVILNLSLSGFVKWNDCNPTPTSTCSLDWPGATNGTPNCSTCVGTSPGIKNAAGFYDPNYVHTTGGCGYDYSDYFNPNVANNVPSTQVGYPAPTTYEGYPSASNSNVGTSFNQTSFNVAPTSGGSTGGTPFMLIDHIGYWKLNNGSSGTGSCWTGTPNYKNLTDLNGYPNQPQNTITINPGQTGGSNITTNGSSPAVIRASSYIEIDGGTNGEFTTGSGVELLLDISACY